VLLCALIAATSFSQEKKEVKKDSLKRVKLDEVIVTGKLKTDPIHTLISNNYDKNVVQPKNVADLFNAINGFSVIKRGNYAIDPTFRGNQYEQLNIQYDGGTKAMHACPNRMDPPTSQMAPNMMDRIEILKGPHALRFGTGFGATINFIPAKLRFSSEPDFYGRLSGGYESNGNLLRGESQFGLSSEKYDVSFFGSWSQGDDYTTGNNETVQSDFNRGSFGTNIGIKLASNQQLRLSATYNRARDADFPALPMDLREDDTWMFNARHDIQFEGKKLQSWNTTVFGSFVDQRDSELAEPLLNDGEREAVAILLQFLESRLIYEYFLWLIKVERSNGFRDSGRRSFASPYHPKS
jgi:iron complex outermembrane receptor protein